MINPLIEYINDDFNYVIPCNLCAKKNTSACDNCSRKRTEHRQEKECNSCSKKPKGCREQKCGCESKKDNCTVKRSICNSEYFAVLNYFSELVHDWEKDLAKYNLGISELESINYFTEQTETGELLNKVQFVFRKGHEIITKEFLVAPKGEKGDKLTWDDLTEGLKNALKGDKGDPGNDGLTPVLRFVKITYSESPCDTSGYFERYEQTNTYDLILTLPKQRTFDECLEDIRNLINLFNINFEALLATLTLRINSIEDFDFRKLGLKLRNGNELSLTYNGLTGNPVILDLPVLSEYSLKYFINGEDMWKDYVALIKDGVKAGDIFSPEKYKPKDWWILSYPGVILMLDGELITDRLRISAWLGALDKTKSESNIVDKNFTIYIQTTATYQFNEETQLYDDNTWTALTYNYDKNTGILTLPKNNSTTSITEIVNGVQVTKNILYRYSAGNFLMVSLWATDHLPRRIMIPIIDVSNYSTPHNNLFTDLDPRYISSNILQALINYTHTWLFDLRGLNFYDNNGDLINCIINVEPSVFIYKNINGKKFFLGKYTVVSCDLDTPTPSSTTTTMEINRFRLVDIKHSGVGSKEIGLVFKYLDDNNELKDLNENQHAAFYSYYKSKEQQEFYKAIRLRLNKTNTYVDLTLRNYDSNKQFGTIYYSYADSEINDLLISGEVNDPKHIKNYKVFVKSSDIPENYYIYLDILTSNTTLDIILNLSSNNLIYGIYTDVFNDFVLSSILDTITVNSEVQQNIDIPSGMIYSNGMFFYNGLFVASSLLDGTPTISDDGEYAYTETDNTVQIQNLSNKTKGVRIGDVTYEVNPKAFIEKQIPKFTDEVS